MLQGELLGIYIADRKGAVDRGLKWGQARAHQRATSPLSIFSPQFPFA